MTPQERYNLQQRIKRVVYDLTVAATALENQDPEYVIEKLGNANSSVITIQRELSAAVIELEKS